MQQRYLGRTGLKVSRLGLGTLTWGRDTDEHEARDQLVAFTEAGGTLVDTAAGYGEGASEDALSWCPTEGDWAMSLPCPAEDLSWVQAALARASARITARDQEEAALSETQPQTRKAHDELGPVDVKAFLRP